MQAMAMPGYRDTVGNRAVFMLRRDGEPDRTEFTMITLWTDLAAIETFTGPDVQKAVFFDDDERYLVQRDLTAQHFEVYGSHGLTGQTAD